MAAVGNLVVFVVLLSSWSFLLRPLFSNVVLISPETMDKKAVEMGFISPPVQDLSPVLVLPVVNQAEQEQEPVIDGGLVLPVVNQAEQEEEPVIDGGLVLPVVNQAEQEEEPVIDGGLVSDIDSLEEQDNPYEGQFFAFGYSYYYPPFGPPNCFGPNWIDGRCKDETSSGVKWSEYMGRGVALHPSRLDVWPFGTVIEVVSPYQVAGLYTVVDRCEGCIKPDVPGVEYIDFLDNRLRLVWTSPVLVRVVSLGDWSD
jgi:hypothetical protein